MQTTMHCNIRVRLEALFLILRSPIPLKAPVSVSAQRPPSATAPDHMDPSSSTEISKLESQIQALTDLSTRLQQLRDVPAWLYKSPNSMMPMEPIREQFENLRQLGNSLSSEIVQEGLKTARESEEKDKSELTLKYRTDTNKAKYV